MINIQPEVKINFSFYCTWIVLGAIISLFCLFISVTFSKPAFLFLAFVFLGAGILLAILFYRGEKKPEHKQTHYMKNLAKRYFEGKKPIKPQQHPRESDEAYNERIAFYEKEKKNINRVRKSPGKRKKSEITPEEIPPVEIIHDEEVDNRKDEPELEEG